MTSVPGTVRSPVETAYLVVAALLAWAGIIIQFVSLLANNSAIWTLWRLLSYLTILTNLLVAYFFTMRLLRRDGTHWTSRPSPAAWITVSITFVGIAFAILLAKLYHVEGLDWWANGLLHYVTPLLALIYWLRFMRTGQLQWTDPLKWSIYVVVYGAYALIRGGISGFYPYPFLDLPTVGFASVVIHIVLLYLAFCVLGLVFVFIDRKWPGTRAGI